MKEVLALLAIAAVLSLIIFAAKLVVDRDKELAARRAAMPKVGDLVRFEEHEARVISAEYDSTPIPQRYRIRFKTPNGYFELTATPAELKPLAEGVSR